MESLWVLVIISNALPQPYASDGKFYKTEAECEVSYDVQKLDPMQEGNMIFCATVADAMKMRI